MKIPFTTGQPALLVSNASYSNPLPPEQSLFYILICSDDEIRGSLQPVGIAAQHWSPKKTAEDSARTQRYIADTIAHFEGIVAAKEEHLAIKDQQLAEKDHEIMRLTEANEKLSSLKNNPRGYLERRLRAASRGLRR